LKAEGLAREIVRRLQVMRRNAGLEIADHIIIYFQGDDYMNQIAKQFGDYIKQETLAIDIKQTAPSNAIYSEKQKLMSIEVAIGIEKVCS
jgi:isoleucyl-tRNA synthetase